MKCILHLERNGASIGYILPFDDKHWAQKKQSDQSRRIQYKESYYFAIILPDYFPPNVGTTLPLKSIMKQNDQIYLHQFTCSHKIRMQAVHPFRECCIKMSLLWCGDTKNKNSRGKTVERLSKCEALEAQFTIVKSA